MKMGTDDQNLLREYAERHSEEAFATLVTRHVNLVYSAALRQVRSRPLAEEVAQSVFTDLAKNAGKLKPDTILPSWLYRVAHRTAVDVVRRESRRRNREQKAVEMAAMNSESSDWNYIEPLLDEAMQTLNEHDRAAVLLRYFESKSLREVGQILGTSEDAAQKRVSRAVERLREFFAKRGVAVGASGLAVVISANAVQAVPAGLAATISSAAVLAGTTVATTTTATITKAIAMTTLQKTLITATIVVASLATIIVIQHQSQVSLRKENESLREGIAQLKADNKSLSKREAVAKPTPRLPAPPMQVTNPPSALATDDLQPTNTNLYARLGNKDVKLTVEQVEPYLKANRRDAASLLAAFRTTGDPALLKEAMQQYPNDPQVAFEAVFQKDVSPEERRQWLDAFKQSAPENSLANYLSAFEYCKAGQTDQAIQELESASGKAQFQDYRLEAAQNDTEAYLAAGYPVTEAKTLGSCQLLLPHLQPLRSLARDYLVPLANSYQQAGDETSAQAASQMAVDLAQRLQAPPGFLINQLVGIAIERTAFGAMDPNSPYGGNGQTVQDRLNQLDQQKAALKELGQQFDAVKQSVSDQDWLNYRDRELHFDEVAAMRWLVNKYGQK